MSRTHWHIIPVILSVTGALVVCAATFLAPGLPGHFRWILCGGAVLCVLSAFFFRREMSGAEQEFALEQAVFRRKNEEFEQVRRELDEEFENRSRRLRQREEDLFRKLTVFHEWMEFPVPADAPDAEEPLPAASETARQKDQQVLDLFRDSSEKIFERIKSGAYHEAGLFQKDRLINDLVNLINSVARTYNPDSRQPLLETSVEQLLRSVNRIALQLLVLLNQLPLDFKSYNIKKIYESVQNGVRAYDTYKAVRPYWNYLRPVYYLGRLALGATPVTLGAGWAISELATRGVKHLSSRIANQYALTLMNDVIFVIGAESAAIFGGDFRHRDAGWIYGAELTELIRRFPVSREMLQAGLNAVGQLQLRNEYDRIFLYRCLAGRKSADPGRFDSRSFLSAAERQTVVEQLERFFMQYAHGTPKEAAQWKADVESRMGLKLRAETGEKRLLSPDGPADALRSLAGFLREIKQRPADDLPLLLGETRIGAALDSIRKRALFQEISDMPFMAFDYPDLDPSERPADEYLHDLIDLCVQVAPHDPEEEEAVLGAARYFRREKPELLKKEMAKGYSAFLEKTLEPESPEKKLKSGVARSLIAILEPDERPRFVYGDVRPETDENAGKMPDRNIWLMGTDQRLVAVHVPDRENGASGLLLWQGMADGSEKATAEPVKNRLGDDCRLKGGIWFRMPEGNSDSPPVIRIAGSVMSRYDSFFRLIDRFCGSEKK